MAFPTAVNDQITDAVTQANVKVLGDAPAQALAPIAQTLVGQQPGVAPVEAATPPKLQTHIWLCE